MQQRAGKRGWEQKSLMPAVPLFLALHTGRGTGSWGLRALWPLMFKRRDGANMSIYTHWHATHTHTHTHRGRNTWTAHGTARAPHTVFRIQLCGFRDLSIWQGRSGLRGKHTTTKASTLPPHQSHGGCSLPHPSATWSGDRQLNGAERRRCHCAFGPSQCAPDKRKKNMEHFLGHKAVA